MCGTQNFNFSQKDVSCRSETSQMENITYGGEIVTSSTIPSIEEIIKITKKT